MRVPPSGNSSIPVQEEIAFSIILSGSSFDDPKDYDRLMPKCSGCPRPLNRECVKTSDGKMYHAGCVPRSVVPGD